MNTNSQNFPDDWRSRGEYGEINVYSKNAVDDWIKQCMKDFPRIHAEHSMSPTHDFNEWFERWFLQFIEVAWVAFDT